MKQQFRLNAYYAVASGIAVLVMAAILSLTYYRTEVRENTLGAGKRSEILARTFANVIWPEFGKALTDTATTDADDLRTRPVTQRLLASLKEIGVGVPMIKVKIYNRNGVAVFSSVLAEIGQNKSDNPLFRSALEGNIENNLTHRGQISATEGTIQNVDVVESYIPIRAGPNQPVEAVFEMYSDVTQYIDQIEDNTITALSILAFCFSVLYGVLLLIVRRAQRLIEAQYQELRDSEQRAAQANRAKSEFLSMMSHELRTPLNSIIGFSEVLKDQMFGELNSKQAEYVNDIHGSGKHLLALINDVLDLAKVEAGRMDLNLAAFDVGEALRYAVILVHERAHRQEIQLKTDIPPDLGMLVADERKLKQIMLNLLSNALKFTPAAGQVAVTAHRVSDGLEVSVSDTGIGIAPEDHARIFDVFVQVGSDYLRKPEGTGLGLALTRSFVELHGGRIRLDSAPGKGSTFTFNLPANLAEGL